MVLGTETLQEIRVGEETTDGTGIPAGDETTETDHDTEDGDGDVGGGGLDGDLDGLWGVLVVLALELHVVVDLVGLGGEDRVAVGGGGDGVLDLWVSNSFGHCRLYRSGVC